MPRAQPAGGKKRPAPKSAQLAEKFAKDTILKDILKKEWRLGDVIGQGGFGLVYFANIKDGLATSDQAQYVVKIEPGSNGPLFCEMNFYIRAAKKEFIDEFVKSHKLRYLAIPPYIGTGIHSYKSQSYRFLVMPRYGTDLQKMLRAAGGKFPSPAVFAIGLRMVDALQYLHQKEYVHADIKAANILLGFNGHSDNKDQVYLADYGLAYRYIASGVHKEYKPDPKSAHNGTIEYTSRDAHRGVYPSRRGDFEILGFCLLHWLCGKLPWETNLSNPVFVAQSKEESMSDVKAFVNSCFSGERSAASDCIQQFLQEVTRLGYQDEPNYAKLKDVLKSGLTKSGQKDEWKINFSTAAGPKATKRKSQGAASPRVSPKKVRTMAAVNGRAKAATAASKKTSPAPKKKKISLPPKTKTSSPSPSPRLASPRSSKGAKAVARRSPGVISTTPAKPGRSATAARKRFDASKPVKSFQLPPPSKPSPKKSPGAVKKTVSASAVRRVRKTHVSRSDASIQTTPTLSQNV